MQMEKNEYVDDLKSEFKEVKALLHVSIPIFQKKCGCGFSAQACCAFFC